ncbi:MAG: lipocalin family protein [Deltaproteobacteria bacterium]|nr:lipocalin family protein [Kofleriaceae bacterium]
MRSWLVMTMLLLSSVAHADEFGGWKFTPPEGATKQEDKSAIKLTTIDDESKTFCQIWLYAARAPRGDDVNKEWRDLVERAFTVRDASKAVNATVNRMPVTGRTMTIANGDNTYPAAFYVLQPQGAVSSVMLLSTSAASLAKCPIRPFLESLALVKPPAAPAAPSAPAARPAESAQPAGAPPIAGTWQNGSSNYINGVSTGSVSSQYVFKPDGTYQFFRENWGGSSNSTWFFTVLETGTWKLAGDQLTLTPKKGTGTEYNTLEKTRRSVKVPLESATYSAKMVYFSGLQEWNLVLTIAKQTARDGSYASNPSYPSSYLFNNRNNVKFKYGPK